MDPQPQPDGEVPDAAKVVGAGEGDESIVGEGVRMQESLAGHTAHLKKFHSALTEYFNFVFVPFLLMATQFGD